jgi:hypothetical protein
MISRSEDERWLTIANQASKEMNGRKLTILVQQLCSALDERNKPPQPEQNTTNRPAGDVSLAPMLP